MKHASRNTICICVCVQVTLFFFRLLGSDCGGILLFTYIHTLSLTHTHMYEIGFSARIVEGFYYSSRTGGRSNGKCERKGH